MDLLCTFCVYFVVTATDRFLFVKVSGDLHPLFVWKRYFLLRVDNVNVIYTRRCLRLSSHWFRNGAVGLSQIHTRYSFDFPVIIT